MTTSQAKIPTKPKGFNAITASIAVSNVADAVAFYAEVLGAETVETLTIPDTENMIYAALKVSGTTFVLNLDETVHPYGGTGKVTLHHYIDDIEVLLDKAVSNGAALVTALSKAWWGDTTAVIVDPFGVRWSLAQRAEQLSASDRARRFAALYARAEAEKVVEQPGEEASI